MARKKKVVQEEKWTLEQHKAFITELNRQVDKQPTLQQLEMYFSESVFLLDEVPTENKLSLWLSGYAKKWCLHYIQTSNDKEVLKHCNDLYWRILRFEAPRLFDSYLIYLERNRPANERFYLPRRRQLMKLGLIQALQDMEDNKYDTLAISVGPG